MLVVVIAVGGPVRFCGNCGHVPCGPRPFSWDKRVFLLVYLRHVYFRRTVYCHILLYPTESRWGAHHVARSPCKFWTDYRPAHRLFYIPPAAFKGT